jgi:hypothetical protein
MAEMFNPQNPELMDLNRQRKLAELLISRGAESPQGQTVAGGIYVPPSPLKYLANLYSTYAGNKANQELDTKEIALANRLRADETSAMADFMQERQGRPGVEGGIYGPNNQLTTETTADMYGPDMALNPQYRQVAPVAATPPNIQTALANLYANPKSSPRLQNMAFNKLIADPEGYTLAEGAKRFMTMPDGSVKEVASGGKKPRAPLQIDTGTAIELRDPENPTIVLQRIPKSQMPNAGQVVETANGPMLIDTRSGSARPIMDASGQPIAPKLSSEQSKDITAINQQRATINGAIADVKANKSAFSFGRGLAQNVPYGESIAGRTETPAETETRAYVFNNVSSVIKERAGAAQSAQELQRLNSFLPATTDNADQIISKLNGFNKYLNDYEKGTRLPPNTKPDAPNSNSFANEADAQKAFNEGKLKAGQKITINGVSGTWK